MPTRNAPPPPSSDTPERAADGRRRLAARASALLAGALLGAALATSGCSALDEQQRRWVFQPTKHSWNDGAAAVGLEDVWIDHRSAESREPVRLHGLWLPQPEADAPTLLYLHGARWDVRSSAGRMRRMHELGFSVLGVDYRGFGQSTDVLPSERYATEDAHAALAWLAAKRPGAKRFVYGHSLGSAIAINVASEAPASMAPDGLLLEGAFPSIPELVATFRYGWLPFGPLVTQRFESSRRIGALRMPVLLVHGSNDRLVPPALGRALYEQAAEPKRFVLVEGGSHHNTSAVGLAAYREAIGTLFGLSPPLAR